MPQKRFGAFKHVLNFKLEISFTEGRRHPFTEYLNLLLKRPDFAAFLQTQTLHQIYGVNH